MNYYFAIGGEQRGPFPKEQLLAQGLRPDTMVWTEGMAQWQRADSVVDLRSLFAAAAGSAPPPIPSFASLGAGAAAYVPRDVANTKLAAGLCGILLGALGVHKFILGMNKAGITMLLITVLTFGIAGMVMHIIGIVEGILYLTKSDEEFYQTYMVQKKAWF
jgi:TM2 domain-containing membrane protein YozV